MSGSGTGTLEGTIPSTVLSICNAALSRLGQEPITSLTEGTKDADTCNANWGFLRDGILRSFDWPCASARAQLSPDTIVPLWGWSNQFTLPYDFLCLREVDQEPYTIEGKKILADATTLNIRYTAQLTDPANYDPLLLEALIAAMMKVLTFGSTGSPAFTQITDAESRGAAQEGKSAASGERDRRETDADYNWLDC